MALSFHGSSHGAVRRTVIALLLAGPGAAQAALDAPAMTTPAVAVVAGLGAGVPGSDGSAVAPIRDPQIVVRRLPMANGAPDEARGLGDGVVTAPGTVLSVLAVLMLWIAKRRGQ